MVDSVKRDVVWELDDQGNTQYRIVQTQWKDGRYTNAFEVSEHEDALGNQVWSPGLVGWSGLVDHIVLMNAMQGKQPSIDLAKIREEAVEMAKKEIVEKLLPAIQGLVSNQLFQTMLGKIGQTK